MKTKINGILTLLLALFVQIVFAQEKTISGVVSDETGGLPGVSVLKKGTSQGTETDFDGKYTITAKVGDVLVFSFVGMKTVDKTIGSSNSISVLMVQDEANVLDEIVVTGVAGATSRKKLSVTVNSVGSEKLENSTANSAASALQGKVAGVSVTNLGQPGEGSNIQLRGATNLFGSQAPMVIVDGVIIEGGLADINKDDIASFEIVKGASASALYGSRAGNGVIVVTTKKGKAGEIKVTLKSELGTSFLAREFEKNNSHAYELAPDFSNFSEFTKFKGVTYPAGYNPSTANTNYGQISGGPVQDEDHYSDNSYTKTYNHNDQVFRTGYDQSFYGSVSGATESTNMYFSADKTKNEGIFKYTAGYERYAVRANVDFKINKYLKLRTRNNFVRTISNSPAGGSLGTVFTGLARLRPNVNLNTPNLDGQPHSIVPDVFNSDRDNPLYGLWKFKTVAKTSKFLGGYNLNIRATDWFNIDTEYSFESIDYMKENYKPMDTWVKGGNLEKNYGTYSNGSLRTNSYKNNSQKLQVTGNFNFDITEDLNVKSKLSYLAESIDYRTLSAEGNKFLYPNVISLNNFDKDNVSATSSKETTNANNIFSIVGIDYKDRYIFDGMYRIDNSSRFGKEFRSNDYFRVSGAYRISKDFDIPGVQELKFHAAYGTAGQRPGYFWQYDQIPQFTGGSLSGERVLQNDKLRPSKTSEFETGLSTSFLNRVNLEVVYSKAKTEDQFMKVNILSPANNGASKQWQNVGVVEFATLEANLGVDLVQKEDFKWNVGLTFEKTVNEITDLNVDPISTGYGNMFRLEEGWEFGSMYGLKFIKDLNDIEDQLKIPGVQDRIKAANPANDPATMTKKDFVVNAEGVVVVKNDVGTVAETPLTFHKKDGTPWQGKIGKQTPDFRLGFSNNLSYKGFNLYFLFDWKNGGDMYNANAQNGSFAGTDKSVDQSGKPENEKKTTDYYLALYNVNKTTDYWVRDASFVKLREVSLSYTLTDKATNFSNGLVDSVKFGLSANNILTITDYTGMDPEAQVYNRETQQYFNVDDGSYPNYSSIMFSTTIKF